MSQNTIHMTLDKMLNSGFTKRQAEYLLNLFSKEKRWDLYEQDYVDWAHENGFSAENAYAYGLHSGNIGSYLSDYDYYKMWPINNWTRIWINDKLTLKYILSKTKFDNFMPEYYFYTVKSGENVGIRKIAECPDYIEQSCEGIIKLLQEKRMIACKPCNGEMAQGFHKLSYDSNSYFIDDKKVEKYEINTFISTHPNYIFTEYLVPSKELELIFPSIHTLRLVVVNESGNNPFLIGGYLRFPHNSSRLSNYIVFNDSNHDEYNINLDIDLNTGEFGNAKLVFFKHTENISVHPETKANLSGRIEKFDELKSIVLSLSKMLSPLEFLGFDIGITPNGFKCMEINSLPGIKYMQISKPLYDDPETAKYFRRKIQEIDNLSDEERNKRNQIAR